MRGNVIRYARQAHGLTQQGLAKLLNTTQLTVCRWENDNQKPSPSAEKRIKEVLGLTDEVTTTEITSLLSEQHNRLQARLKAQGRVSNA